MLTVEKNSYGAEGDYAFEDPLKYTKKATSAIGTRTDPVAKVASFIL